MRRNVVTGGLVAVVVVAAGAMVTVERLTPVHMASADNTPRTQSLRVRTGSGPSADDETGVTPSPPGRVSQSMQQRRVRADGRALKPQARSTPHPQMRDREGAARRAHAVDARRREASAPSGAPATRLPAQREAAGFNGETPPPLSEPQIAGPPVAEPPAASPPASLPQPSPPAIPTILTPPVPLDIPPPAHPMPYRMVVDAPGLSSAARLEAVEARVRLRLVIRADGTIGRAEIAVPSGRTELDAAAMDAVRQWRFLPARRDGEATESVALIWVAFIIAP